MAVMLDTTVLIDALRGDESAIEWLLGLEDRPSGSEVTRVEIISGLRSAERATAEQLLLTRGWRWGRPTSNIFRCSRASAAPTERARTPRRSARVPLLLRG